MWMKRILSGALIGAVVLTLEPIDARASAGDSSIRQQVNAITSFIDGSMIYGSDEERANYLRSYEGGKLKMSDGNLLPSSDNIFYEAGDVRVNENIALTAVQTLFVREHNYLAGLIATEQPSLSDEQLFQVTRKLVSAEIQRITYNEFLPALLGEGALTQYTGYKPEINPSVANEFATAAFRIGHTLLNNDFEFLDNDGNDVHEEVELKDAFFNPSMIKLLGPDPLLKYLASDNTQEVDLKVVDGLRNFLFGPAGAGGLDLASLNIQRGRDHGLADYNTVRKAYGLPGVTDFSDITRDFDLQEKLESLYGNVDNIDLWVGGLAEDHVSGSSVGITFRTIIADQFERTRDGDRFWYQKIFSDDLLERIESTTLSDIIKRNTTITNLQESVFFFDESSLSDEETVDATRAERPSSTPNVMMGTRTRITPLFHGASYDASDNNRINSAWGTAGSILLRMAPAHYSNGTSSPAGADRPSARQISNEICALEEDIRNNRNMSDWVYVWGQFIDHDIVFTAPGNLETFEIPIPKGDPYFDPQSIGTKILPFFRSFFDYTLPVGGREYIHVESKEERAEEHTVDSTDAPISEVPSRDAERREEMERNLAPRDRLERGR